MGYLSWKGTAAFRKLDVPLAIAVHDQLAKTKKKNTSTCYQQRPSQDQQRIAILGCDYMKSVPGHSSFLAQPLLAFLEGGDLWRHGEANRGDDEQTANR